MLLFADHSNGKLLPSTLHCVSAARRLSDRVLVLVSGAPAEVAQVAQQAAAVEGVSHVYTAASAELSHPSAESLSALFSQFHDQVPFQYLLGSCTASAKNAFPRFAVSKDVQPLSEVIEIPAPDTFVRPVYAGNAVSTYKSSDALKVLNVRPANFPKATVNSTATAKIEEFKGFSTPSINSNFVSEELTKSARPELTAARVVVSGGRGMKSGENFKMLEELADKLGGAVGASRAAVDAGFVPNDYQVGQTGKVVAPDLYIAVGISGAIQHLAGMKDSKTIVAINKDPEAPIYQVADYGLVADLFKCVPELTQKIKQ